MPTRLTQIDLGSAVTDRDTGTFTLRWQRLMQLLFGDVAAVSSLPAVVNRGTYAELNALGLTADDEGYLAFEHEYGHLLRWTGTAWQFAPGDPGNGFFSLRAVVPQEVGWHLCDGNPTDYLTLGATLSQTPFTTPAITPGSFLNVLASYTGTETIAIAPGLSGSVANATATISGATGSTAPAVSGSTASDGSHDHDVNAHRHAISGAGTAAAGADVTVRASSTQDDIFDDSGTSTDGAHTHGVGSLAVASHTHSNGTLAVDAHLHTLGTIAADTAARPPAIGGLLYFRR